jgi:hypothetical protein
MLTLFFSKINIYKRVNTLYILYIDKVISLLLLLSDGERSKINRWRLLLFLAVKRGNQMAIKS